MYYPPKRGRIEILQKHGITRWKNNNEFKKFKDEVRVRLYEQQGGCCYYSGRKYPIEQMNLDHKLSVFLLRNLGFCDTERWSENVLCMAEEVRNNKKGCHLHVQDPILPFLLNMYIRAAEELNIFETDPVYQKTHPQKMEILLEYM